MCLPNELEVNFRAAKADFCFAVSFEILNPSIVTSFRWIRSFHVGLLNFKADCLQNCGFSNFLAKTRLSLCFLTFWILKFA